eukprot:CAMPEP_0115003166 /NCGR_PEP_ID=MMETSP0216-20121206/18440_1 /TAXON_ID=223996 /ORGANISM="Protocruzia adherens, Strain Boccale" /LENGTH=58 /DNA_ID=CAMNT_0002368901 /DNA_START=44 /DNA_END=216 /DNA_ORIENTATION=-
MILDGDGKIDHEELEFFLKGNTSLEPPSRKKPYPWISDIGWKDLERLGELGRDKEGGG